MDSKTVVISLLLAAVMAGSGALVYTTSNTGEEPGEPSEKTDLEMSTENNPPKILMERELFSTWTGEELAVQGFLYDEDAVTSYIIMKVLNQDFIGVGEYNISVDADGKWTTTTGVSGPGSFILDTVAYDREGLQSEVKMVAVQIDPPFESEVNLTFGWDAPEENETIGTLQGAVFHEFPETCTIEYRPDGQHSSTFVIANVSSETNTYTMQIDTAESNTNGLLVAGCGLFDVSERSIAIDLPVPPEPVGDDDGDAVPNDVDACPETPTGEPVYSTGCSDSETDDDGDGVVNSNDICPDTPAGETADLQGCSNSQKDTDNDGVKDHLDACSGTPSGEVVDEFGCSESQKDDDADGVPNDQDTCPNTPAGEQVNAAGCSADQIGPEGPRKILALHGGGETANGLRNQQGMQDLMASLSDYEFVFASAPESNDVWIRDPPGGKGEPTTDRDWADNSIAYLDQLVEEQGPFYAILGYSQGAAMIPVYLANSQNTFERVLLYNGYLPTTHDGLMDTVNEAAPFSTPAMVFSGENDDGFKDMAPALAQKFTGSTEVHSQTAGHHLPYQNDAKYNQILAFIENE
ncbi:hypothetical protein CMO85_01740 [Candidatus Woesearchaeota archaeon]|nr:hypothetical protein [Candidatus Woesearchaeota archaeon]